MHFICPSVVQFKLEDLLTHIKSHIKALPETGTMIRLLLSRTSHLLKPVNASRCDLVQLIPRIGAGLYLLHYTRNLNI